MNKVTIHLDGKHDTLEVKGKILSILPEVHQLEFDTEIPYGEPNRLQKIKSMGIDEMDAFLKDWFVSCSTGKAPLDVKKWLESKGSPFGGRGEDKPAQSQSDEAFDDYHIAKNG